MISFEFSLDPDSPVPVFHQIAEAIRYRIATGRLRPGDPLPSVRDAGDQLDVHYLTVRRAYEALKEDGLVESRRGIGTRVVETATGGPIEKAGSGLEEFLEQTIRQARMEFALAPEELVDLLRTRTRPDSVKADKRDLFVVECNEPQARDYARQLEEGAGIRARTWLLSGDEPPPGLLAGTYFHFNDLRERWPRRSSDMRFVTVSLDAELRRRVQASAKEGHGRFVICETDESRAHNVLPDLHTLLRDVPVRLETMLVDRPESALNRADGNPVFFSPRLWAELEETQRSAPRSILLRYVIRPTEMMRLARDVESEGESVAEGA
jgi:GntR family transcriptional regulator